MKRDVFQRSLKIGLGRIIVYLQHHDAAPYQDLILYDCLNDTVSDAQVEGFKTNYLLEIIALTNDRSFYLQRILDAASKIDETTSERTASHLIELAGVFAEEGDARARQIIYDVFLANLEDEDPLGVSEIIELDKTDGFLFIAEKLGAIKRRQETPSASNHRLWLLNDIEGEAKASQALSIARASNTDIDFYLNLIETDRLKDSQSQRTTMPSIPSVYAQMEAATLFSLLEQDYPADYRIPALVFSALKNIDDSAVRDFGLRLIAAGRWVGRAVGLLRHHFQASDWELIETLSAQTLDDATCHDLTFSVSEIFKLHPDVGAIRTLLNLYEIGPCSFCREQLVVALQSVHIPPRDFWEECLYDSNEHIREIAREHLTQ